MLWRRDKILRAQFDDEVGWVFNLSYWTTALLCFFVIVLSFGWVGFPLTVIGGLGMILLLYVPCALFFILFFKGAFLVLRRVLPFVFAVSIAAGTGSWLCLYFAMALDISFSPFSVAFDFGAPHLDSLGFLRWLAAIITTTFALLLKPGYDLHDAK